MAVFSFGGFELDTELYQLSRTGEPVDLGAKAFDVLHYLICNCDRIVPKNELIREVWGADSLSDSSIPTCISAIRHALGDSPAAPKFIVTYRARGYRFTGKAIENFRPSRPSCHPTETAATPAFVGRKPEMELLHRALAQSLRGLPGVVLVTGDAGIGKTRLVEEFAHDAKNLGAQVLFGRCREDDGAPAYWPWIQMLRGHFAIASSHDSPSRDTPLAIIDQLLPDLRRHTPKPHLLPHFEQERARFWLFDAVSRFFQEAAVDTPIVLLFDDLHRADTSSMLLLEFLISDLRNTHLLVVATYRHHELSSRPTDSNALSRITRAPITRSLQLHSLPLSAVAKIIGQPEESEIVSLL